MFLFKISRQLLENVDVNPFGTTYTLLSANDASVLVNTTNSLSNLYLLWNNTNHQTRPSGLNLPNVLRSLRTYARDLMDRERAQSVVATQSLVSLIIGHQGGVSEADTNFAVQETQILREVVPDLNILFLASGVASRFNRFVRDPSRDIFSLQISGTITDNIPATVNPIIQRIRQGNRL